MKYFLAEIEYLVPTDKLDEFVSLHRAFLQSGYDQEILLISGPKVPRTGAFLVTRSENLEAIQAFFAQDPYQLNHLVKYHFQEFNPVKFSPRIKDWIES
ncbi:hypothetical protein EG832_10060 [bacterium]|nr:hypothetical protein [bacterium]